LADPPYSSSLFNFAITLLWAGFFFYPSTKLPRLFPPFHLHLLRRLRFFQRCFVHLHFFTPQVLGTCFSAIWRQPRPPFFLSPFRGIWLRHNVLCTLCNHPPPLRVPDSHCFSPMSVPVRCVSFFCFFPFFSSLALFLWGFYIIYIFFFAGVWLIASPSPCSCRSFRLFSNSLPVTYRCSFFLNGHYPSLRASFPLVFVFRIPPSPTDGVPAAFGFLRVPPRFIYIPGPFLAYPNPPAALFGLLISLLFFLLESAR